MALTDGKTNFEQTRLFLLFAPYLFVFIWSTGFAGARFGLPFAEPFTLLSIRFATTVVILTVFVVAVKAGWPSTKREAAHIGMVGILAHAGYLGGMFYAMSTGMPLGIVALIGGLQPLLTAVLAGPVLAERVDPKAWFGLFMGLGGVILVLWDKLGTAGMGTGGLIAAFTGLSGMTAGTLYQKRFCASAKLATGAFIQFTAALAVIAPLALLLETNTITLNAQLVFAVAWLAVVLSLGGITLLWLLVRWGEAAKVASIFYLTPAVTAVMAAVLFGEPLTGLMLLGMAITATGVAMVTAPRA
jgi:drug/metabolite transporter (DMT)-like permease